MSLSQPPARQSDADIRVPHLELLEGGLQENGGLSTEEIQAYLNQFTRQDQREGVATEII
jgi:hypothetical protein